MSWCDKLASTPTVGLKFEPRLMSSAQILDALAPVLEGLMVGDRPSFVFDPPDPYSVGFTTNSGFKYNVDPGKVAVQFVHRMQAVSVSAGPPIVEMLSKGAPYSTLLSEAIEKLIDIAAKLPDFRTRKLQRIGVVSNTVADFEALPPGLVDLIDYFKAPWGKEKVSGYNVIVLAKVATSDEYIDQCVHSFAKSEDATALMSVQLDWGRVYSKPKLATESSIKAGLTACREAALAYFEEIAEGTRFDDVISAKR